MQLGLTCHLCPRNCGADRSKAPGYCGAPVDLEVSSVCIHRGEEPPLNPIVNLFFAHCNLQCIYCQNRDISRPTVNPLLIRHHSVDHVAHRICQLLPQSAGLLGLVTPSHYAHLIPSLLQAVHARGFNPVVVYNTSGYESVPTLRALEGLVDIYLPDFKYADPTLAQALSNAPDYPDVASAAIREMIRQVGPGLKTDASGTAYRGIIVRHLLLPGHLQNTLLALDRIAQLLDDKGIDPHRAHVSLMAQYYPPFQALPSPLDRTVTPDEYAAAASHFQSLGFDGWLQQPESSSHYRPDFSQNDNPFDHCGVNEVN